MPQWLNLEILCDVLSTILFTIDKKYINDFSLFYNGKSSFYTNNNNIKEKSLDFYLLSSNSIRITTRFSKMLQII